MSNESNPDPAGEVPELRARFAAAEAALEGMCGGGGDATGSAGLRSDPPATPNPREQTEEALRRSEERFRVIASSTPDHLLVQDRDLRYTLVLNPQRMSGICLDVTERRLAEDERRRQSEALRATNADLVRFNQAMRGRELRMVELKQEVNDLCARLGPPPRYSSQAELEPPKAP